MKWINAGVVRVAQTFCTGLLAAVMAAVPVGSALGAEIKCLCALGMKEVIDELGPRFEKSTKHKLTVTYNTMGGIVKLVQGGEAADVVIVPQQGLDTLVKDGKITGNVTTLATSGIVVVYRKGAAKPDVSTPDALKRALLAAKSVTYGNPADGGASGIHFAKVLDRLGIAKEIAAKTVYAKAGTDTGVKVAAGEAELGVNQRQILAPLPGIEVAGPLPGDLQSTTVFAAAVTVGAKDAAAAKALIDFLRTPEAAKVFRAKGMEPG